MRISTEEQILLSELCAEHKVSFNKVLKLLSTVQDYELMEKRMGIYDALEEIIKQKETPTNG